jgi:hypothetical protein
MGCGASNNNIGTTSTPVVSAAIAPNTKMSNLDVLQTTTSNQFDSKIHFRSKFGIFFSRLVPSTNTSKILIVSHTTQQKISERLRQGLLNQNLSCYLLNESTPHSLTVRANVIQWCDVFVVIISRLFQRTPFCMEALNYAKDMHTPIIAIYADRTFRPYGALGAITASAIRSIVLNDDNSFPHAVSDIANTAHAQTKKETDGANIIDESQVKILYFITDHKNDYFLFYSDE